MNSAQTAERTAWFSLISNFLVACLKGIVGYFGNSYALIADAIESTGDVFASILVVFGIRYARRPPDENHPYGHGKVEPLITFAVVGFLCVSATIIIVESIHMIQTPHPSPKGYTLWFLGGIIIIKEAIYRYVSFVSKKTASTSLKADAWHHRSDAITSLFAFIGIAIAIYLGDEYAQADDWAALIAAGVIFYNAFLIFRPALGEIMDEHTHDEFIDKIRVYGLKVEGVRLIEKCFVRKSGMRYWVDAHVHVDGKLSVFDGHEIGHQLKSYLMNHFPEIEDVLVHIEPSEN
jgi:cation diffusion facilitator family transporter